MKKFSNLVKAIGLKPAYFILIAKQHDNNKDWFIYGHKEAQKESTLKRFDQDTSIRILIENNLIEKELKGIPAKRCFKINYENLAEMMKG